MSIIIPALVCMILNLHIFMHVRSSSRRVHPLSAISNINTTRNSQQPHQQQQSLTRRDIRLLLYMTCTFAVFIIGWSPFYFFMLLTRIFVMNVYIYIFLAIWAELSVFVLIVALYIYNKDLRDFLRQKSFPCCR